MRYIEQVAELRVLLEDADYVGVKAVEGDVSLQEFLQGMFAYRPRLIRFLYRVRSGLVRLLGIRQQSLPEMDEWIPREVPMLACGNIWFFSVSLAREDRCWIGCCPEESHLIAFMGVVVDPLPGNPQALPLRHHRSLQALDRAPVFPADTTLQPVFRESAGPGGTGGKKCAGCVRVPDADRSGWRCGRVLPFISRVFGKWRGR